MSKLTREDLEKEDLELINQSLRERYEALTKESREGITERIRKVAKEEADATNRTWRKVCQIVEE